MTLHSRFDGDPDAPVLVLSGSLGSTIEMWEPQLPALTARFRVLRYDHPGHGRSPVPNGPIGIDDLGRGVLALLDELGLERVSFGGLSLGGIVGMWLGIHAPDRVDRLALCCTGAYLGPPEQWTERAETVRRGGVEALADAVMDRWFTPRSHAERAELVARFREMLVSTPAEGYARCCEVLRDADLREELTAISAPTVVIAGADDPAVVSERTDLLAQQIPGARLVVIPETAHIANAEQPGAFNEALLEHLGAVAA